MLWGDAALLWKKRVAWSIMRGLEMLGRYHGVRSSDPEEGVSGPAEHPAGIAQTAGRVHQEGLSQPCEHSHVSPPNPTPKAAPGPSELRGQGTVGKAAPQTAGSKEQLLAGTVQ